MPIPTDTALRARARALLEAMQERGLWVYALPRDEASTQARPLLEALGFGMETTAVRVGSGEEGDGLRGVRGATSVEIADHPSLEVAVVKATGPEAPEVLGALLDKTGFFAQSTLLRTAYDLGSAEASAALGTLAFMAVRWDARWAELFGSHLGSQEESQRVEAALALRGMASQLDPPSTGAFRAFVEAARASAKDAAVSEALAGLL